MYQRLAATWRMMSHYESPLRAPPPEAAQIIEAASAFGHMTQGGKRRGMSSWLRNGALAAAAMGAVAVGYGASDWLGGGDEPLQPSEVVTEEGERSTAQLADGTVVRLAPESRLVLNPEGRSREVFLEGRAFFAVASDSDAPFLVRGPGGEARVLGTRFEIITRAEEMRVVVIEGLVSLGSGDYRQEVGAHQVSHARKGEQPSVLEVENVWKLMDWVDRFLAFEGTRIGEVAEELEARFGVTLELEDPKLADETITVWFGEDESLEEVVSVVCRLIETECSVNDGSVWMGREDA